MNKKIVRIIAIGLAALMALGVLSSAIIALVGR